MSNRSSRSGKPISGPLYLPALDGLRGLALLLIVFFHLAFAVEHHPGAPTLPQQTEEAASRLASVPDALHFYFGSTNYFLAFFFILSGFVLFLPIAAKGEFGSVRSFAIRRLFRMIPAFYVSLLILLVLVPTVFEPEVLPGYDALGIFSHLTFTHQEFSAPGFGINGALWTVSIDAVFYLILPLIAVWYFRHPFIGLALGLAIGVAWQLITVVPASTDVTPTTAGALKLFVQFPLFADEHALGMTAAWVVVHLKREKDALARRLAPALALGFLFISLGLMYWSSSQAKLLTVFNAPLFFTLAVPIAMTVCLVGTVFLTSRAAWVLTNPVARWIGDTSYSAYLYHGIVLVFVFAWLDINVAEELPLALAVYIPAVALCGWISFILVERPARTVGHRIARRYSKQDARRPPVAVPASHPEDPLRSPPGARAAPPAAVEPPPRSILPPMATRPREKAPKRARRSSDLSGEELSRSIAPVVGPEDPRVFTDSGIEIKRTYEAEDVAPGLDERLGEPGQMPFTRGIHEGMYRDRLWTMRQYAGFASPEDTNERYRYLTEHGSTGLSMAFDLPTQLGRDSDDPLCRGEVGRTGVPIDTIEDMRICFDQIPLDEVSTSMTINAPAAILLLLYELVGEEQGVPAEKLRGTVQNDVLKEYVARGNYIYPPEPTMRLTTDIFEYCHERVPKWNTISISGYHIREKGCSAVQEVAFTLANAIAYVGAALDRGLVIDEFAPRLAFFFNGHNNVFQEIAKFRAVRRMWARIVKERFGAENESSMKIRFHTQTGGVTLQAQQPEVNIIRVALQGFAAVCGGTQSLHTNGFDEALALPTERSARIALRTQQVLAHESGAADTVDPFAGSYFIEALTDEIEERAWELIGKVEELGGSVEALDFIQREIEESALSYHERYRSGQDIVVGVNKYVSDTVDDVDILRVDPEAEERQLKRLAKFKSARDQAAVDACLGSLREVAEADGNLLHPIREALAAGASIGEVCGSMRDVFGEYRGGAFF